MTMRTHMANEVAEIPVAVARFLEEGKGAVAAAAAVLRERNPSFLCSIGRGSSDHAATFLSYAFPMITGRPVASLPPSLASIWNTVFDLENAAALAISQSGGSADITAMTDTVRQAGAFTLALTNVDGSPLEQAASARLPLCAGPEKSVAATKSYVNSIVAGLALAAEWADDSALKTAINQLPRTLENALALDWSEGLRPLAAGRSGFVLARGAGLGIAAEAALKCKETSGLHVEAYSAAEVIHGPMAIVRDGFPVLILDAGGPANEATRQTAERFVTAGATVTICGNTVEGARRLERVESGHILTDTLALIVPVYAALEALSREAGFDPDKPKGLSKVTVTV